MPRALVLVGWRKETCKNALCPERDPVPPFVLFPTVCENCIELNIGTISGFIFAEIISIFFLAVGVYFIAGQDGVRQSRGKRNQMW